MTANMQAVIARRPGGVDVLEVVEVARPACRPDRILVRNFAAALNRADILQRRGLYPPPPGESEIPGLEFAGEVAEVGDLVRGWRRGDRVCGLVGGGAYAEFVEVDPRCTAPIPDHLSFDAAAAVPEAFCVAGETLLELAGLREGESVLVHAGASGIGTAAIQLARHRGARVLATSRSAAKLGRCRDLGAAAVVDTSADDFAAAVESWTSGRGVDVLLDLVGGTYAEQNVRSLAAGGRWLVLGLLGGGRATVDLGAILARRLRVLGSSLRYRSAEEKAEAMGRFRRDVLPAIQSGDVRPVIDRVFPLDDVRAAQARMEANENVGKIVLRM